MQWLRTVANYLISLGLNAFIHKMGKQEHLGGSVADCLPLTQVVIPGSSDKVLHWGACFSLCLHLCLSLSLSLSVCVSLMNK